MGKMLKVLSVVLSATLVAGVAGAAAEFKSEQEKQSYAIGVNVAKKLKLQGVTIDTNQLAQGLSDEVGGKSRLTEAEVETILQQMRVEVRQKQIDEMKKLALKNQERGTAFLAEYAKKEKVKALPGGVLYRVLQPGTGPTPTNDDAIRCNYRGTLVDGTVFDASEPGKPAYFDVDGVMPGWREALQKMPVGSKWELVIPAEKAYGESGSPPAIGPNETLIFEVELLEII